MKSLAYPAVYRVAMFFAAILALSALSSDSFLSTNPSPLHSAQIPEPPQSSQVFKELCLVDNVVREITIETTGSMLHDD